MKKVIKRLGVLVLCFMLMGGVGVPSAVTNTLGSKTAVTVQAKKTDKLRKKFKKTMDEYLKVMKKHCKFLKKYNKINDHTASMVEKKREMNEKLDEALDSIDKWPASKLNDAEKAYRKKITEKAAKMLEDAL